MTEKSEMALETAPSEPPPAYSSPVIHPQIPNATTYPQQPPHATTHPQPPNATTHAQQHPNATTTTQHDHPLPPANGPPPSYRPKRTPSQESIYIRELKAWAAEKSKMHPGAYGEYDGKFAIPPARRPTSDTSGQSSETSGLGDRGRNGAVNIPMSSSSAVAAAATRRRVDSGMAADDGVGAGSVSPPFREGSFKRRMSNFMGKLRKQEGEVGEQSSADDAV